MGRNWGEVTSNEFLFNRSEKEVEALGKVTLDEVKAVLEPLLKERKISVQVKEATCSEISRSCGQFL